MHFFKFLSTQKARISEIKMQNRDRFESKTGVFGELSAGGCHLSGFLLPALVVRDYDQGYELRAGIQGQASAKWQVKK